MAVTSGNNKLITSLFGRLLTSTFVLYKLFLPTAKPIRKSIRSVHYILCQARNVDLANAFALEYARLWFSSWAFLFVVDDVLRQFFLSPQAPIIQRWILVRSHEHEGA